MKLSTKARYGARLMLDLAVHSGEGPILLRVTAQRQDISEKYLSFLAGLLKSAGLINSARGCHGGYSLGRPASEITLKDIVSALEGPIYIVDCIDNFDTCERAGTCAARGMWRRVNDSLLATLASVTLDEVVKEQTAGESSFAYAI